MEHKNYNDRYRAIQVEEYQELESIIESYGEYYWDEDEEKPIISVCPESFGGHPFDLTVSYIGKNDTLFLEGENTETGVECRIENLMDEVAIGHIQYILDYMPEPKGFEQS